MTRGLVTAAGLWDRVEFPILASLDVDPESTRVQFLGGSTLEPGDVLIHRHAGDGVALLIELISPDGRSALAHWARCRAKTNLLEVLPR